MIEKNYLYYVKKIKIKEILIFTILHNYGKIVVYKNCKGGFRYENEY